VDGNLSSMYSVFTPSVGVEHVWVDLNGRHVVTYFQCTSNIFGWSVGDLDFQSMTSL